MIASTVSGKALRFSRAARHHIANHRRTSIVMSAETLNKSTPEAKWKELLSAEEVRNRASGGSILATAHTVIISSKLLHGMTRSSATMYKSAQLCLNCVLVLVTGQPASCLS